MCIFSSVQNFMQKFEIWGLIMSNISLRVPIEFRNIAVLL